MTRSTHHRAGRRRSAALATLATSALAAPAIAQVHESDIILAVPDGAITTNAVVGGQVVPDRVFTGVFGDSGFPGFTSNPGFDCAPGTFAVGTRVGFDLLGPWQRWDPTVPGFVATGEDGSAGERLELTFFTLSVVSEDGPVPGFDLAVQPDGGWHRHLDQFALAEPGEPAPDPGVYAIELQLYSTDPEVGPSEPFFLVHDLDAQPVELEAAVEHLRSQLEPPACPADIDASGDVGFPDLLEVLVAWGAADGPADLDGTGVVDFGDILLLLTAWGPCP